MNMNTIKLSYIDGVVEGAGSQAELGAALGTLIYTLVLQGIPVEVLFHSIEFGLKHGIDELYKEDK